MEFVELIADNESTEKVKIILKQSDAEIFGRLVISQLTGRKVYY